MTIKVAAHGFELTPALKESCENETIERLSNLSQSEVHASWVLSIQREDKIAHLHWSEGGFSGDVKVKNHDMYASIHQAAKKAAEQLKKNHDKKYDPYKHTKPVASEKNNKGASDDSLEDDEV